MRTIYNREEADRIFTTEGDWKADELKAFLSLDGVSRVLDNRIDFGEGF